MAHDFREFEKWCAIRASVGGVGGLLACLFKCALFRFGII